MGIRDRLRREADALRRRKADPLRTDPDPEREISLLFEACDAPVIEPDAIDTARENEQSFFDRQRRAESAPDPTVDAFDIDRQIDSDFEVIDDLPE